MTRAEHQREYQRRYRQRQRRGVSMVAVPVPAEVIEGLLIAGRLDDAAALDKNKVAAELAVVLRQWAAMWLKNR